MSENRTGIRIDANEVVCKNILGLGIQWDPQDDMLPRFTEEQWNMNYERIDFMQVKFARVMMQSPLTDIEEDSPHCDFALPVMESLYKILDYCQENNIAVMTGEWNKPENIPDYDDPRWIKSIADSMEYLYHEKKYSCLRYYNFVNEPNGDWMIPEDNWNKWDKGIRALYEIFQERGISQYLKICGPDSAYGDDWVDMSIETMSHIMQEYEYHIYVDDAKEIMDNQIEMRTRKKRELIDREDADGKEKLLWLGELGCKDGVNYEHDCQDRVYDFIYGVWMADAVVQVFRSGLTGVIPWDLDDAMHIGGGDSEKTGRLKRWGFWNTLGGQEVEGSEKNTKYPLEDRNIRPWFYTMSLLSRLFPGGSDIVSVERHPNPLMKMTAASFQRDGETQLSIVIVNEGETEEEINILMPRRAYETLYQYNYFEQNRIVDENGMPKVSATIRNADFDKGLTIKVPPIGVVFLSSIC